EYSRECYCASALPPNAVVNATGCTMPCAGNSLQTCGGRSRLSIYNNTSLSPPGIVSQIQGYMYQGCFTDPSAAQRVLSGYSTSGTSMTQELCVSACKGKGMKYAGVEFGKECYCSNVLGLVANGGKGVQTTEGDCSMLCAGDKGELCGGRSRIAVWLAGS